MTEQFPEVGVEATVKGFGTFIVQMEAINLAIGASGAAGLVGAAGMAAFNVAMRAVQLAAGAVIGVIGGVVLAITSIGAASLDIARSVDSAFASVAKTTDGLVDDFGNINAAGLEVRQQFRDLAKEVPLALEELLEIGALAGQLGIPQEALADFTRTIAALGVSTDLSVEQATLSLARILNIYDVTAEEMAGVTERLASSIVFLGNNFATTEPEITDFAERIAGAAKIANILPADIAGIAAAFTSVGVEAQAGGTAVQTVIIEMTEAVATGNEELGIFAKTAGLTVDEFVTLFEDDAAGAFGKFVAGLGEAGIDAFQILDDLGVADRRIIRGFLSVAGAGDLLTETIEASNQAFEDNTALTREATIRYETFDSKLQIFKNTVRDIGLEIGDGLLPIFEGLLDSVTPFIEEAGPQFVEAFNTIRDAILDDLLPAIGEFLDALGVDISQETLIQSISKVGETIAGGIEAIANLTTNTANFLREVRENGLEDTLISRLGIDDETAEKIKEVGEQLGVFLTGFFGFLIVAGIVSGIVSLIATVLGVLTHPLILLALLFGLLTVAIYNFGEQAWITIQQLGFIVVAGLALLVQRAWLALQQLGAIIIGWIALRIRDFIGWVQGIQETIEKVGWGNALIGVLNTLGELILGWIGDRWEDWNDWANSIVDLFNNKASEWKAAGKNMLNSLWDGLKSVADSISRWVSRTVQGWIDKLNSVLKMGSPSRVFMEIGENMMLGLTAGLNDTMRLPERALLATAKQLASGGSLVLAGAGVSAGASIDRSFNPTIHANYAQTQSPNQIRDDINLLGLMRG